MDPFASSRQTLLRAQHHTHEVTARVNEFTASQPWSYVIEPNADHTLDLHKIKFARRLPVNLASVVFDACNNLRAALDQAAYATARLTGNPNPKARYFPFGDDEAGLDKVARGRCKDLPAEIVALFKGFKPYRGGNNALWALNKLCNSKKHCALVPFALGSATVAMGVGKIETSVEYHPGFRRLGVHETVAVVGGAHEQQKPTMGRRTI